MLGWQAEGRLTVWHSQGSRDVSGWVHVIPYSSVHVRLCEGAVVAAHGVTECCVRAALQCLTGPELFIPPHLKPWAARAFPESLCANPEPTGL